MLLACQVILKNKKNLFYLMIFMVKEKRFSAHDDFKTGFFFKLSFIIGVALLIIYLAIKATSFLISDKSSGFLKELYNFSISSQSETILALSILLIALSIIIYAFNFQLCKLSKIADDIENNEEYK